jgi:hypothetical protein
MNSPGIARRFKIGLETGSLLCQYRYIIEAMRFSDLTLHFSRN